MRFLRSFVPSLLLAAGAAQAASSWSFDDATLSVGSKKADSSVKEKFSDKSLPKKTVDFGNTDTLKIILTAKEGGKAKRPHQAFLTLQETETGLEAPFVFTTKESGKATVDIKHSDLPVQLLKSTKPLKATLTLASFGSSTGYNNRIFDVEIRKDPLAVPPVYEKPMRYGKREEIHHIFKDDPKSPPKVISLVFTLAVAAMVPVLLIGTFALGGNVAHLPKAFSSAPVSHGIFYGSIIGMEFVFYMYYSSWNLFQVLPVIGVVGVTSLLSGSKALGEVQRRRLAGER
ncbi:Dolichyl-diphosphooligosaccharide--protein glycosyltransferase subunit 2 [Apiospora marii]|uniref:Dolichyl-diphosphooligosaccharide--protein glycosyltransferase subunit 2 n=1 Tax=Apiospora marii TaxID=335849 RepID=UPI00312DB925